MKFQYVGDDNDPPRRTVAYGYAFELHGDPVTVMDPRAQAKLRGNRCFAEVRPKRKPADGSADDKDQAGGVDEG